MLRVRVDGGQLDLDQLRTIADISQRYGRDTADITDRQNIQLHWIRIEDVPAIWRQLEAVGLQTTEACGDTPAGRAGQPGRGRRRRRGDRPDLGDRRDRRAVHRRQGASPTCRASSSRRSRGWPTCRTRSTTSRSSAWNTPTTGPASTCGSAAACPPTRCSPSGSASGCRCDEVAEVWAGVVSIFRDYGYRRLRHRARLKFLVADWGVERFREVLEKEYLGRSA